MNLTHGNSANILSHYWQVWKMQISQKCDPSVLNLKAIMWHDIYWAAITYRTTTSLDTIDVCVRAHIFTCCYTYCIVVVNGRLYVRRMIVKWSQFVTWQFSSCRLTSVVVELYNICVLFWSRLEQSFSSTECQNLTTCWIVWVFLLNSILAICKFAYDLKWERI